MYEQQSAPVPYRPREFVVLEAPSLQQWSDEESTTDGRSTAEIIASQSQDYVDEKLAEYQATIYMLQGNDCVLRETIYYTQLGGIWF